MNLHIFQKLLHSKLACYMSLSEILSLRFLCKVNTIFREIRNLFYLVQLHDMISYISNGVHNYLIL
jgi:hypothetical protein